MGTQGTTSCLSGLSDQMPLAPCPTCPSPLFPCGFHDVFPYSVTVHKMNCFPGEYHDVNEDCFPAYLNAIRPVLKRAINLAALDIGFQQLLANARQQSPLIKNPPTVAADNATPPETEESKCPPPPSRLARVEERLLRLQEEFTHLARIC